MHLLLLLCLTGLTVGEVYNPFPTSPPYANPPVLRRAQESCDCGPDGELVGVAVECSQVQDTGDACACDVDGVINGIDTGRPGCADHTGTDTYGCYVPMQCRNAEGPSAQFPGTQFRFCDPAVDNVFEAKCSCGLGSGSIHDALPTGVIPDTTSIRLMPLPSFDSEGTVQGRLEVFHQSTPDETPSWGTVCSPEFDLSDAQVGCAQLGAELGYKAVSWDVIDRLDTPDKTFGPVWLGLLECGGGELLLEDCPSLGWSYGEDGRSTWDDNWWCDHTYNVSIFHSHKNPQLLGGTQHVLTIEPADTNPSSCDVEFPSGKSIVAGSSFDAVVIPFDEFENPTAHAGDAFASRSALEAEKEELEEEKEDLEEEVRRKKHSEEELKAMVDALEAVSKERQDELKEVMMESKELKVDRLLGKGGFGVVNLAIYRGSKVAMKQLLTVNEENVLRFRHECFLMKNLSHPNIVKLAGVCWSEDLFACCLEFVENGSLEFWLRLTAGGKKWVAAKIPVIGKKNKKKKKKKKGPSLSEVTFKGFDHNGDYNTAEHTDLDRAKREEAEKLLHDWWMQRMNPKMGWEEILNEDKSRLSEGVTGFAKYDDVSRCGEGMAHCYVNATPKQVCGWYANNLLTDKSESYERLEQTYTTSVNIMQIPIPEEEAGWKESVVHRDLKPDNMLLTRDWTLKLTDFGEARAQNMGGTMTSVGTPIYIAPEVMRGDHYDERADTWSYGLCLVAMIRAERTLEQFFYQALRKHKKRRTTKGLGMGQMTKYYYSEGWRPILPLSFVKAYPKLHALIQECWRVRRKERPNFDQIVARLQGEVGDEIKRKEEPEIVMYSKEDDEIYRNRMGKEDELSDSEGEEEGGKSTRRERGGVSKAEYDKVVAAKDKAMAELRAKSKAMRELQEKAGAEKKKAEAALEEKTAEAGRWGAALQELKIGSPDELRKLAQTFDGVMKELEERRGGV
ncbi:hypothetical protein TeGR_g6473 [Tetraparma gracilis]|uniref:Protein kinase domain-containing protein n=1 Tax=Tetraparma gracilis TaxID=2962635 RepID=A0ABQ6MQD5_9STRA|nr:hypothetical protein TeGR_g6473 [Tetraparma gracilis]